MGKKKSVAPSEGGSSPTKICGTIIKPCDCKSAYQDAKYGNKQRIYNWAKDGKARCTVCGTLR